MRLAKQIGNEARAAAKNSGFIGIDSELAYAVGWLSVEVEDLERKVKRLEDKLSRSVLVDIEKHELPAFLRKQAD